MSHFLYPETSEFVCLGDCFTLCEFQACVCVVERAEGGGPGVGPFWCYLSRPTSSELDVSGGSFVHTTRTKGRKNTQSRGQCGCVIGHGTLASLGVQGIIFCTGLDLPCCFILVPSPVTNTNRETCLAFLKSHWI